MERRESCGPVGSVPEDLLGALGWSATDPGSEEGSLAPGGPSPESGGCQGRRAPGEVEAGDSVESGRGAGSQAHSDRRPECPGRLLSTPGQTPPTHPERPGGKIGRAHV